LIGLHPLMVPERTRESSIDIQPSFFIVRERVRDKTMGMHIRSTSELTSSAGSGSQDSLVTRLERLSYQSSEERLMLAILKDAVDCIERYRDGRRASSRPEYKAALAWVHTHDHTWLFSFENICVGLDLNSDRLRTALESPPLRTTPTVSHGDTFLPTVSVTHRLAPRSRPRH